MKEKIKAILESFGYPIGMIIFALTFYLINSNTFKIIGLIGLFSVQLLDNLFNEEKRGKVLGWVYLGMFILYFLIFTSLKTGESEIALASIIVGIISIIIMGIIFHFFILEKAKNIYIIIWGYLGFTIFLILLFGFLSATFGGENGLVGINETSIRSIEGHLAFNAFNFYSVNFGETPYGIVKVFSFLELIVSFIFHSIILAQVMNDFYPKKKEKDFIEQ